MLNDLTTVHNSMDSFCNTCIQWLSLCSERLGISYGEINVWLFCIIMPFMIVTLLLSNLLTAISVKRIVRKINIITLIVNVLLIIFVLGTFMQVGLDAFL